MPSLYLVARTIERMIPRSIIAMVANLVLPLRSSESRAFSVDADGRWIKRQPEATFVSSDVYTAHYAQVERTVFDYWCQLYTPPRGRHGHRCGRGYRRGSRSFLTTGRLFGAGNRDRGASGHLLLPARHDHPVRTGQCRCGSLRRRRARRSGYDLGQPTAPRHSIIRQDGGIEVPARSLDSLLGELQVPRVDFLKMNIEGAERPAMKGMREVTKRTGQVAIACHDFIADSGGSEQFRTLEFVQTALRGYGLEVQRRETALRPWLRDTLYARRTGSYLS